MYKRLPNVPGFGIEQSADKIGLGMAIGAGAVFAAHGIISSVRKDKDPAEETKEV
jgi:hydrogenase small subunit